MQNCDTNGSLFLTSEQHVFVPMMTSSNGNIYWLLVIFVGNSPVTSEFPAQRPVTWSFDVFFDLHLNKQLSKQLWDWWFETPSYPLWRHCNAWLGLHIHQPLWIKWILGVGLILMIPSWQCIRSNVLVYIFIYFIHAFIYLFNYLIIYSFFFFSKCEFLICWGRIFISNQHPCSI